MSSIDFDPSTSTATPVDELIGSLKSLYDNAEYSDLTIASRDTEHRVHRAIVCPRSEFFATKFQESKIAVEGYLALPDDDPQAVGMVMRYFYYLDYPSESHQRTVSLNGQEQVSSHANGHANPAHDDEFNGSIKSDDQILDRDIRLEDQSEPLDDFLPPHPQRLSKKQKKRAKALAKQEAGIIGSPDLQNESFSSPITQEASIVIQRQENHSEGGGAILNVKPEGSLEESNGSGFVVRTNSLVLHANVYALSKKYGIPGLRSLAFDKFKAESDNQWNTEEFLHAAEKVYTSCSDSDDDRQMKDVVVGMICRHGELMDKVETQKVMRTLPKDLMYDILLQVRQQGGFIR